MRTRLVTTKVTVKAKKNRRRNPELIAGPMGRAPTPAENVITRLKDIKTTLLSRTLLGEAPKDASGWRRMLLLDGVG